MLQYNTPNLILNQLNIHIYTNEREILWTITISFQTSSIWYTYSPVFVDCYLFMYLFVCRPTQLTVQVPRMITQFILYEIALQYVAYAFPENGSKHAAQ